jgi:hypothetical protein
MNARRLLLACSFLAVAIGVSCSSNDKKSNSTPLRPKATGAACTTADDCYTQNIDRTKILGTIECLDRVRDGYCTHQCATDADCCAVNGECPEGLHEVCSPFESTGVNRCFVSCEDSDLTPGDSGVVDANEFCQRMASPEFICRSTGGGSTNRQVCVPGDCGVGADCTADADCPTGTVCLTDFHGGYCSVRDCTATSCPAGSACVAGSGGVQYCVVTCAAASDCSFCRTGIATTCTDNVQLVDGTTASVCMPTPN